MNEQHPRLYGILFVGTAFLAALFISWQWVETIVTQDNSALRFDPVIKHRIAVVPEKLSFENVKALYLTAYSAGSPKKIDEMIDLFEKTELNAIVIDIKDYSGKILYDSELPIVNELKTDEKRLGDVKALIEKLHEHDIYIIARQTVFQDPILSVKKPEWAIGSKNGGLWHDKKGLTWVDPTKKEVWDYNVAIGKEAVKLGFDEINFDYVRFPSDGNMNDVVYTNGEKERHEIMKEFYQYLGDQFQNIAPISLDVFGFVMERPEPSIGQSLEDMVDAVDFVYPMMYPSHYPAGHLGFKNPAEHPAEVFEHGMAKGMPLTEGKKAKIRPWIQAFNLGAVYDAGKIREQIDVIEKYTDAGWLMWNASNRYSEAGLKSQI